MIEEFINSSLAKYPANKDNIYITLVGFGSILKIVFSSGLVLDYNGIENKLSIPHYSQVKEEICEEFINFDVLKQLFEVESVIFFGKCCEPLEETGEITI